MQESAWLRPLHENVSNVVQHCKNVLLACFEFASKDVLFPRAFVGVLERENVTLVQVMLNNYYFNFRSGGPYFPTN